MTAHQEFRYEMRLAHKDFEPNRRSHMWCRQIGSLDDIGPTLRVDTVTNEGEGLVAAARVQARVTDPEGVKAYLILDAAVDRLTGRCSLELRDDRGHRGAISSGADAFTGRDARATDRAVAAILRFLGARIGLEGHAEASRLILETLARGGGLGYPKFNRTLAPQMAVTYRDGEDVGDIAHDAWYLAGEVPPAGWLAIYLFRTAPKQAGQEGGGSIRVLNDEGMSVQLLRSGTRWIGGPHAYDLHPYVSKDYGGRTVRIPTEIAAAVRRHVTPRFGPETDAEVDMPQWTKPLDTLAACLERIKDRRHAFDMLQHLEAVEGIIDRRDALEFNVDLMVPHEGASHRPAAERARWKAVIQKLSEYCVCCGVSKIFPARPRVFAPDESKSFRLSVGGSATLAPDAADAAQGPARLRAFLADDGRAALEIILRPYSEMLLTAWLFPETHDIRKLAESLRKKGGPLPGSVEGQTLFQIVSIDADTGDVTLVPDGAFTFIHD